ncbi:MULTISPECIES: amino acid ABC transporter ATP-binding protein [Aerococcus]|uniref:Amino acid ABC transporter ATP-binding protein n=1 Tax=Aerococcus sanguinicola TaxID=119206 RepID=A0A5N1GRJ2_9LACT|nr:MULTISPECIES: amino acid ABC transporter ATP-binding protein [Aerococcus]KAA9301310.1 amino acid ABC transporter ATP-binding protein [Aerococcus sanguinicola]MDK6370053.1 amino acid ABC transporter ATP-binding protein [Aerococcus sp. UMB9870]MDK6680681.1 amino acid ABC transporter ATP-binding protein [Aerococcus sp. UMB8608]MDK6687452.1 amino acid ABC transporter ATP-binding protein [Aerococcus sp. UMB8623]MDK6940631.1 amino acid ABC transporter ATP-binding protein [Aerococcus sp. UMB8487]
MANLLIEVDHLHKSYDGETEVLQGISLSIERGELTVIIGPSGCGKSTFLRCLNALEPIDRGEIYFKGQALGQSDREIRALREQVGMVFQSYELFPHLSVMDNLTLAPCKVQARDRQEAETEARKLLAKVGLADKAAAFPSQLSGGQKQRVAIVRALMMHPEVLLLDEITAALDPELVREVLDVVLNLAEEGLTMVMVTHEMSFAEAVADQIVFFDAGQIVESSRDPQAFFRAPMTLRAQKFLDRLTFDR